MPKFLWALLQLIILILLIAAIVGVAFIFPRLREVALNVTFGPTDSDIPTGIQQATLPTADDTNPAIDTAPAVQTIAENLDIPWEIQWLPDASMLVTERPGRLLRLAPDGTRQPIAIPGAVQHTGESGLLGMALHPDFAQNNFLYLYFTETAGDGLRNRVERYVFSNNQLTNQLIIVDNIPGAPFHSGGRIAFGPDGFLYITTGDAQNPSQSQNPDSLAGKILRVGDDGLVQGVSFGHRNPQGIAWDTQGNLWSTEHGRSGALSGLDELNLIQPNGNYGWPESEGDEVAPGTIGPTVHSGPNETWAPASLTFIPNSEPGSESGSLFFAGLRGESLYEAKLQGTNIVELKRHFTSEFGRLRTTAVGPDGFLYLTTSNTDGRGEARDGDDKIIRIDPAIFLTQ